MSTGHETGTRDTVPNTHPRVLFDGVCNLCNASVQWLIEHDPKGHFRFASLQSQAARRELERHLTEEAIENLPDAIVLVDENGVHTRSTAALRIARRLGFPWAILSGALVLPRPFRDAVYDFVARNRYRWFGHRDTCMVPTPETAARFLDADEPTPAVEVRDPAESAREQRRWISAWVVRLVFVYVLIYVAPFPLNLLSTVARLPLISAIPGVPDALRWIVGLWSWMMDPLVSWVGSAIFGIETAPRVTGSGDQTFHYVTLFTHAGLAVIGATIWTTIVRARRISALTFDVTRVIARYYLAWYMLIYGWIKVFPLQMPQPGPDKLLQPFGDSSPMGIVWSFIGVSTAYQIFSGLSELVGGYLLFWRRTALAGSLVAMAVTLNIMAINFFFDVPVKLFSAHLFLIALFIAAPDLPRLFGILGLNLPVAADSKKPYWKQLGWSSRWAIGGTLATVTILTWFHIRDNSTAMRSPRGLWRTVPEQTGFYRVESFIQGGLVDRENEDDARWVRVGLNLPALATIQRASGEAVRGLVSFDLEEGTASFWPLGTQAPEEPQFTISEPEDGVIRLEGEFEGKPTTIVMRKTDGPTRLMDRGFRWINEVPFNR